MRTVKFQSSAGPRRIVQHWHAMLCLACCLATSSPVVGQDLFSYHGDPIPTDIERMYIKGLGYLVNTQASNGTWSGNRGTETGVVGLSVLAMLAHGDDPNFGPHSQAIKKGLGYILASANSENGYIGSTMYNHGFATLALAEAYGHVNDPRLGPALEKAVALILTAQSNNGRGAWRYSPTSTDADATVSGAQMVALFAARNAGIAVPEKAIRKGLAYLRQCQGGHGGFGYTSPGSASAPCTAIGTLALSLAKQRNTTDAKSAFRHLQQIDLRRGNYLHYYLYYASQAFFHVDTEAWQLWNKKNTKRLAETQMADGHWEGGQGPVFTTSASLLSMAVNYRFLPIYER
jgi:hypothetical protein